MIKPIKIEKMNLTKEIKKLEKKGIISRKPHPIIPFALALIIFLFGIIISNLNLDIFWGYALLYLSAFTFVFAIIHLIVVRVVE